MRRVSREPPKEQTAKQCVEAKQHDAGKEKQWKQVLLVPHVALELRLLELIDFTQLGAWNKVGTVILFITVVVWLMDIGSAKARERLR